ncbi:hypothetical protein GCM10020219_098960 [Nonomuraea dietziae]
MAPPWSRWRSTGALSHLLTQPSDVRASYGLDDLDAFLSRLIVSAYPHRSTT